MTFSRLFSVARRALIFQACLLIGCIVELEGNEPDGGQFDGGLSSDFDAGVDGGFIPPVDGGNDPVDAGENTNDAGNGRDAGMMIIDGGNGELCPSHALFCESFEDGLNTASWSINGNAATFSVDTSVSAAHGAKSLHAAYGKPYSHTGKPTVQLKVPIPAPDDRIYVRTYLRFENLGLPGFHPFFVDVLDTDMTEVGFGSIINDFALMAWGPSGLDNPRIWYENGVFKPGTENGDITPNTEKNLKAKEWFCLELMLFGDHQSPSDTNHDAEEAKVWINGVEITDMNMSDAIWRTELGKNPPEHWSPRYDNAKWRFGVESFGPTNVALDIWFDAIAFSHQRIGCLK